MDQITSVDQDDSCEGGPTSARYNTSSSEENAQDPDLTKLVESWDRLPDEIRLAIVTMVNSVVR